ncbi:transposase [Streptomyces sp. NPDC090045]|uniref:transposase n=1 Tax=Streptomyces sp. NPDC090045 TaxID=3365927 RepID=UPI00382BF7FD
MFAPLVRRDQRAKGQLYLRGLLLDGWRKSMQPMAERLGVNHEQLQQLMTSSTWPVGLFCGRRRGSTRCQRQASAMEGVYGQHELTIASPGAVERRSVPVVASHIGWPY